MTKRNARYEILGRHFYDCFTLFTTNKTKLGLKTYRNDKILLDYIRESTKNSRIELFKYLEDHEISYAIIDCYNDLLENIYFANNLNRKKFREGRIINESKALTFYGINFYKKQYDCKGLRGI